jgi:MoxR-like ATPase
MTKSLKSILQESGKSSFTRADILAIAKNNGIELKTAYQTINNLHRLQRGVYTLEAPVVSAPVASEMPQTAMANIAFRGVASVSNDEVYVPAVDPTYIKWGEYNTIMKIIKSKMFFPTYIAGLSGNGKTMMVEQACAKTGREYVRVQISPETDEDDLIGGFRLVDGETIFQKGPVIKAMERGCILLIDEIDRATNKIMCLQGVLEGSPVLLKKTGEVVTPAEGFNVIGTANTKGRGSDDGRFTAASIIDDAFLERFVCVIDQAFPQPTIEKKIVEKHMAKFGVEDTQFAEKLIAWSNVIRKTFEAEGVEEVVSTRRLCHIVKSFSIFNDRMKAINMCISRFDEETRTAFLDLYTKIDESQLTADGEVIEETNVEDVVNAYNNEEDEKAHV